MAFVYWMLCALIAIVPTYFIFRKDRKKGISMFWLPSIFRFLTFFCTAALLLAPAFSFKKHEEEKPLLLWLQDNSTSIAQGLKNDTASYRQQVLALNKKWGDQYNVVPLSFGANLGRDNIFKYQERVTNISNAIQSATEQYQDRNVGAIILSTDGIYNEGLDPLYLPLSNNIPIYTIGIGDSVQPKDISVARVFSNKTVASGSVFEVIADLRAVQFNGLSTTVNLMQGGRTLASSSLRVDKDRYSGTARFEVKASGKGFQKFTINVPAQTEETNQHNNTMDFFVNVIDEENKVLIWAVSPHPDISAIKSALEDVPLYKVTVKTTAEIPSDLAQYNLVIAHQIPLNPAQAAALEQVPTWFIVGGQSNLNLLNNAQKVIKAAGGGATNSVEAQLNTNFGLFTLPEKVRQILPKLPPLFVPQGAYTLTANSQNILTQQRSNSPLWAMQLSETPKAVLLGEGIWRWRMYEYKNFKSHDVVDELVRQTVSLLSVRKDREPFKIFLDKYVLTDNDQVVVYAELRNANLELINTPEAKLELKDSTGKVLAFHFEKTNNSYRINLGLMAASNYTFSGSTTLNGKNYTSSGSFVVEHLPLESLRTYADFQMLYQLSKNTGGTFFTQNNFSKGLLDSIKANKNIAPIIHTQESQELLINRKWFFFLILLFAVAEWLLRKYWSI